MGSTPNDDFTFDFNHALQGSSFSNNPGLSPFGLDELQLDPASFALMSLTQHSPAPPIFTLMVTCLINCQLFVTMPRLTNLGN
jgi:hypothetical protein